MGLGGKVDHGVHGIVREQAAHQVPVADIALDEDMAGIARQGGQGVQIAGVGQLVQVDDLDVRLPQQEVDKIAPDEAGATGNQDGFHHSHVLEGDVVVEVHGGGSATGTAGISRGLAAEAVIAPVIAPTLGRARLTTALAIVGGGAAATGATAV
jgi:hypothetical protein